MSFGKDKCNLVNGSMGEGFKRGGLTVPAADHDPGVKNRRSDVESNERKCLAEKRRQAKLARRAARSRGPM